MKIPLSILGIVLVLLLAFHYLAPTPGPDVLQARTDLPWQVTVHPDGTSRVLDIELGRATLADASAKFGAAEGLAVFEEPDGERGLEAYFGNVQFGPLTAKIIVTLAADDDELERLAATAQDRQGSRSGAWKYSLGAATTTHAQRRVRGITYIPGTRNLDAAFLRERFGAPAAQRRESDQAVTWFYPALGLTILVDDDAREVFEYQPPRDFVLPPDATAASPEAVQAEATE
jgi:hypothetical protein